MMSTSTFGYYFTEPYLSGYLGVAVPSILDVLKLEQFGPPSQAPGTVVDMAEVVRLSAIDESGGSEEVTQPTVAEAAAGVGILVGDTQLNSEQTVCTAGCV